MESGLDDERALRTTGPAVGCSKRMTFFVKERRATLPILRKAWPKLNALECLDIAKTITQAASLALNHAMSHAVMKNPDNLSQSTRQAKASDSRS